MHDYQSFLKHLPADWSRKEIQQLGTVVGGGTPSRDVPSFWNGSIPWVTPSEVSGNAIKLLHETKEHISAAGLAGSGATLLPAGSLMVTTRATLGARAINAASMATNQGFKSVVFKQGEDVGFYFHFLEKVKPEILRRSSGTTFLEISSSEFGRIEVPSPHSEEKRLITEVLDTIDTAIHETEAIIAKLKAVKQGLLHDLLTRGIDANGELRPPLAEAPHLYKQSQLGWIPKEWTALPIGKVASLQRGYDIVESSFCAGKFPVISSSGVVGYHNLATSRGPNVVVGRKGSIGTVHYIQSDFWAHDTSLFVTNFFGNSVKFVYFLFGHLKLARYGTKSGSPSLNRNDIHPLKVSLPRVDEQTRIVSVLSVHDEIADRGKLELGKLRQLKQGLIDDLLTGRVRVTSLLSAEQQGGA